MTAPELTSVVDTAQRLAGVVAARDRGDAVGAQALLRTLDDPADVTAAAVLVAELALGLLSRAADEPLPDCVSLLCLELMAQPR